MLIRITIFIALATLAGCGGFGKINQGQVVAYDRSAGRITLISDSNYLDPAHPRFDVLPPVTIRTPADPREMGPEPEAGKLLVADCAHHRAVFFDSAASSLRTVPCTLVSERSDVPPAEGRRLGGVSRGNISVYQEREQRLITFSVPEEYRTLPDDTWRAGDEIRYYYKEPDRALRLMNVTRTELESRRK